jgi:hypothetical protein
MACHEEKSKRHLVAWASSWILPLHLLASEHSPGLKDWLSSWVGPNLKFLEPIDWFYAAQQGGDYSLPQWDETWAWILAPAAALDALEELRKGQLKRHEMHYGVVIFPTLLTCEWYQWFQKNVDIYFTILAGSLNNWSTPELELLTIGLYLPLLCNIGLGIGNDPLSWYCLEGCCQQCTKKVTIRSQHFCNNWLPIPKIFPSKNLIISDVNWYWCSLPWSHLLSYHMLEVH